MDDKPNKNRAGKEGKKGDRPKDQNRDLKTDTEEIRADNCKEKK